jgi:hypothetical protein
MPDPFAAARLQVELLPFEYAILIPGVMETLMRLAGPGGRYVQFMPKATLDLATGVDAWTKEGLETWVRENRDNAD